METALAPPPSRSASVVAVIAGGAFLATLVWTVPLAWRPVRSAA